MEANRTLEGKHNTKTEVSVYVGDTRRSIELQSPYIAVFFAKWRIGKASNLWNTVNEGALKRKLWLTLLSIVDYTPHFMLK
jgi:hypothetical protein